MQRKLTLIAVLSLMLTQAWAQGQPQVTTITTGAAAAPVVSEADTIEERANAVRTAERLKSMPTTSTPVTPSQTPMKVKAPAPEYTLVALRGWLTGLEAVFVINGKRVTGSMKYPSLTEGWRLVEVSQVGAVIAKAKERRELSFVGPEPYQAPPKPGFSVGQAGFVNNGMPQQPPLPR